MKLAGDELVKAIETAVDGLLFPSETDAPIAPVLRPMEKRARIGDVILSVKNYPEGTSVRAGSAKAFFEPAVDEMDWFGDEEKARAGRFQALLDLLRQNLTTLRAYRVGDVTVDVYVVGKTSAGELAGIVTSVVET